MIEMLRAHISEVARSVHTAAGGQGPIMEGALSSIDRAFGPFLLSLKTGCMELPRVGSEEWEDEVQARFCWVEEAAVKIIKERVCKYV